MEQVELEGLETVTAPLAVRETPNKESVAPQRQRIAELTLS
ncbi:MAG: hypothetical protein QOD99_2563 [Chthoniobacter sp.]|nr:hypothetical protein [Chthoniobacter sp.]